MLVCTCLGARAQNTIDLVNVPDSSLQMKIDSPVAPKVLVVVAPIVGKDTLTAATVDKWPLFRDKTRLAQDGIGLVRVIATDALTANDRESRTHLYALARAATLLHQKYPDARLVLGGMGGGAGSVVAWMSSAPNDASGYDSALIVSGYFRDWRNAAKPSRSMPLQVIHPMATSCPFGSSIEAREVTQTLGGKMVLAYGPWDTSLSCSLAGSMGLAKSDDTIRESLLALLDGQPVSGVAGDAAIGPVWKEQMVMIDLPEDLGGGQMESTVLYPDPARAGPGPWPLMVFHHGDPKEDGALLERDERLVEPRVAREFLDMGYIVAIPERPGVGKSGGHYRKNFSGADPTAKGKYNGSFALYASDALRRLAGVDRDRVLVSGQSAGGYAVLAIASTNPPWIKGIVDFSGGRTNVSERDDRAGRVATGPNQGMYEGFQQLGAKARIPVEFVFAENDSRYSVDAIRDAVNGWSERGGLGHLDLYPALTGKDGHFVYNVPELWRADVQRYLGQQGLPNTTLR